MSWTQLLRPLIGIESLQRHMFYSFIGSISKEILFLEKFQQKLEIICSRHFRKGVKMEHFAGMREIIISSFPVVLGDLFTEEMNNSWNRVFCLILKVAGYTKSSLRESTFHEDEDSSSVYLASRIFRANSNLSSQSYVI